MCNHTRPIPLPYLEKWRTLSPPTRRLLGYTDPTSKRGDKKETECYLVGTVSHPPLLCGPCNRDSTQLPVCIRGWVPVWTDLRVVSLWVPGGRRCAWHPTGRVSGSGSRSRLALSAPKRVRSIRPHGPDQLLGSSPNRSAA